METGIVGNSGDVQITQISTDAGAVDAALDYGREIGEASLDFAGEFGSDALREAFSFGSDSLGTVERGLNQTLDFGENVVDRSFDFGSESLDLAGKTTDRAFDFSETNLDRSLDFGEKALANIAQIQADQATASGKSVAALSNALGTVGALSRSDTSDALTKIIPWIAGAIGVGAVAFAFRR